MSVLRKISMYSALIGFGGYFVLHQQLKKKYPDVPLYNLPDSTHIKSTFPPSNSKTYIAYCDTFKTTITTTASKAQIADSVLKWPTLQNLQTDGPSSTATGAITGEKVSRTSKPKYESVILKWNWAPSSHIVSTFEWLAGYGYPWRLMNGGYHEILVQQVGENTYDVYFVTAHEYNNLRDGKVIPGFMQALHKDFGRLVLHFGTQIK
ncbi:CYFA0S04e01024g1_1 [Cyberlindnera fabianii]|uniref:CYFA0S04e01024g1_1 n=1 Tax=Cyberlindnera fabianii TaxID=36022 RepID=A0A061AX87_CYBFA|nr:CYFA0S04e01024g1_1 [Cyberlindnera fabianii]